jgi:hypothetical protein
MKYIINLVLVLIFLFNSCGVTKEIEPNMVQFSSIDIKDTLLLNKFLSNSRLNGGNTFLSIMQPTNKSDSLKLIETYNTRQRACGFQWFAGVTSRKQK